MAQYHLNLDAEALRALLTAAVEKIVAQVEAGAKSCVVTDEPIIGMGVDRAVPWLRVQGRRLTVEVLKPEK